VNGQKEIEVRETITTEGVPNRGTHENEKIPLGL
jgi:hypothetical protein